MKSLLLVFVLLFTNYFAFAQTPKPDVQYLIESTKKIEQLVGDYDNQLHKPTQNLTNKKYKLWGTDLGVPFDHNGKTYVLFGDIPLSDEDPIAFTSDSFPEDGINLQFIAKSNGDYNPINIPGISQGAFEVPVEGISVNNIMYVYHTTDNMKRLSLAKSMDNGKTFELVESNISTKHFINISVVEIDSSDWLPGNDNTKLLIFGSGKYRKSDIYLAVQPVNSIENKNSLLYFKGVDSNNNPIWSKGESNAKALFKQTCVGEFSVTYNQFIKKWLMLYNCDNPRGINFRTADKPWGVWSKPQIIFEPWNDKGYCNFIHTDWNYSVCDSVHDSGRAYEWGGEYGPYQFENYATGTDTSTTIYYTMSTWNPYTVVLMKSTLIKPLATDVSEIQYKTHFLYCSPNPITDKLIIEANNSNILIYNNLGQLMKTGFIRFENLSFDTSKWQKGIYFVKSIDSYKHVIIKKVIKI